jgi:CheY-like chemotaxis protein
LNVAAGEGDSREDGRGADRVLAPGHYAVITIEERDGALSQQAQMALFESVLPARDLPGETGAIVSRGYTFVRQWGGDISVFNTPEGTRISIYLPFAGRKQPAPAAKPAPGPAMAPAAPAEAEAAKELETILVVEDEAGIRALVRKILRRQGYTVLEASNGEEAMKLCQEHTGKIDLLITDVMMPKMGGRELADALKEHCRALKVLYVSGYTDDAAIYSGDFPPGTAFLQKPFTLGSLLEKVKDVLGK